MKKRIFCMLLSIVMVFSLFPMTALAAATSGSCGNLNSNVNWSFDTASGVLTISGEGGIAHFSTKTIPWYDHRGSIKSVVIQDGINMIGDYAFANCKLTEISIPDSVTYIGRGAFMGCAELKQVDLPDIEEIGSSTFNGCSSLTEVTIPDTLTEFGENAFKNCTSLTKLNIPAGVETLADVFDKECNFVVGTPALKTITVHPDNPNFTADEYGVVFTKDMKTLLFAPGSITNDYVIPDSVEKISNAAFRSCNNLTDFVIPEGVFIIEKHAFADCTNLKSLTVPNSAAIIGQLFLNNPSLTAVNYSGSEEQWKGIHNYYIDNPANFTLNCDASATVQPNPTGHCEGSADKIIWTYDRFTRTLIISGSGAMLDYDLKTDPEWAAWSEYCEKLVVEDGITHIGDCAFNYHTFKEATIAPSVITIGERAFRESKLESLTLPEGITTVEKYAFENCEALKSFTFSDTVAKLGDSVFSQCTALEEVHISKNFSSVGRGIFWNCSALKEVRLPDGMISLNLSLFHNCESLEKVYIPASMAEIAYNAFDGCTKLQFEVDPNNRVFAVDSNGVLFRDNFRTLVRVPYSITGGYIVPDTVTAIGEGAFCGNKNLTDIVIQKPINILSRYAINNCSNLENLTLPKSLNEIHYGNFVGCGKLTNIYYAGSEDDWLGITIDANNGDLEREGLKFHYNQDISPVPTPAPTTAPDAPTGTCGDNLTWVYEELNGVLTISGTGDMYDYSTGKSPWYEYDIKALVIEKGVTSIGNGAFSMGIASNRAVLDSVTIADTVTKIGASAFSGCTALPAITLPDSVTEIGHDAFTECKQLRTADLGKGLVKLGANAFSGCGALKTCYIPDTVTELGHGVFSGCYALAETSLPDGITEIGATMYWNCVHLTELEIPDTVTTIDYNAFRNAALKTLDLPAALTTVGNYAFHNIYVTELTIPSTITSFGSNAFGGNKHLNKVTFADGFTTIPKTVLADCSELQFVYLPASVTKIENGAFKNCKNISDIYFAGSEAQWNNVTVEKNNSYVGKAVVHFGSDDPVVTPAPTPEVTPTPAPTPVVTPTPTPEVTPAPTPEVLSGSCGDGIAWEFEDGTLSIIGTGSMQNFKPGEAPWAALQSRIKALNIYEGITVLGENCFDVCTALTDVYYGGSEHTWKQVTIPAGNDILSAVNVHFEDTLTWSVENGTLTIGGEGGMMDYVLFSDGTNPPWADLSEEITAVVLEDGVTSIGNNALARTNNITQITLGKDISHIGSNAFGNCNAIAQVTLAEENPHFIMKDGALCSADGTRLVMFLCTAEAVEYTIPEGITVIGENAFYYNRVLKTAIIPEGVTTIEDGAFDGTFLERIYIPKSVTEMGTSIVYAGNLHQEIHYAGTQAEWEQISKNDSYASYHTVVFESPAPIPEVTPTPELTPAPTPEVTPTPTPEVTPTPTPAVNPFEDVAEDAWYNAPVLWAVQNGITSGTSATTFGPEDPCTRGAIVTFLWAANGRPEPAAADNPFEDVSETDWYYKPIMWAVQQGITGGTSETTFSPNNPCTRAQVATFLWAAKGKPEVTATESPFLDVAATDWFFKPVMWAVENGITSGIGDGLFGSENICTRAQIATFLYKVYG